MGYESWLWIKKKSGKKLEKKKVGAKKSLYTFVNLVTNIKNYLVELTEVGCKTFFFVICHWVVSIDSNGKRLTILT